VPPGGYGELVPTEEIPPKKAEGMWSRPVSDLLGPEGGLITQALDPSEGLVVVPFAEEWQSYFPDGSPLRFPKWPFPNPDTTEFLRGYGEPLWLIVEAAVELRRTLSVIAYYKSKRREPNESQRQSIRSALSGLTALAGPESLDVDESGSVKADSHPLSSSLL
jgi:hypothetical protein